MTRRLRVFSALLPALFLAACASTPPARPPQVGVPSQPETTPSQPTPNDTQIGAPIYRSPPAFFPAGTPTAQRIVQIAKREHQAWYQAFIDVNGRLAARRVSEAERDRLSDGTPAWERVVAYWRDSGTLYTMVNNQTAGAYNCQNPTSSIFARNDCRIFLVDVPWSAAFISYVMYQARVEGFRTSPSHIDYIRQSYRGGDAPYAYRDPAQTPVSVGDMICYVRGSNSIVGHGGLTAFLAGSNAGLQSHCDIVVNIQNGVAELIGGNVVNGVTMRKLRLDANGIALLPRPIANDWSAANDSDEDFSPSCSPSNEASCSMNRQNWAVLLKLVRP